MLCLARFLALAILFLAGASVPVAASIVVLNDGLNHVVSGVDYFDDTVYVQNMGCDATVADPCVAMEHRLLSS